MPENKKKGIWEKLFQIQKSKKSFVNSEESDKRDSRDRSVYLYTPGYEISEAVRAEMDKMGLMLIPNISEFKSEPIEYPVYKMINGEPRSFTKKEIFFTVKATFTWIDTETGEQAGPYNMVAAGANGTDKSCASALALAERYFLLKFFHFSTRDADLEPDAHDSSNLPGLSRDQQPSNASPKQACAAPNQAPQRQGGYAPAPAPAAPMTAAPYPPQQPYAPQPSPAPQVNIYQGMPQYQRPSAPAQAAQFDPNVPVIKEAVEQLIFFEKGTSQHQQKLNECMGRIAATGISTDLKFINNLIEAAQARRENRAPVFEQ